MTQTVGLGANRNQSTLLVADWNNDGRVDVLQIYRTTLTGVPQSFELRMNRIPFSSTNHWLTIDTVGTVSNRDGQGTQIAVYSNGIRQRQQVRSSVGLCGTGDTRVHFGLGAATSADRIELRWPSGQIQVLENVPADQFLTVVEPRLELVGAPRLGTEPVLRMDCPGDSRSDYAILLAVDEAPGIPLPDGRTVRSHRTASPPPRSFRATASSTAASATWRWSGARPAWRSRPTPDWSGCASTRPGSRSRRAIRSSAPSSHARSRS